MPADQKKCHAKRLPNENWGFLVHNWDGLPLLSADCQAISAFKMDYVWHTTLTWMGNFFPQRQGSSIRWQERIINSYSPTDPFTILMSHKPSIGVSELHKIPRSTDLETLKLGKGPFLSIVCYVSRELWQNCVSYFMLEFWTTRRGLSQFGALKSVVRRAWTTNNSLIHGFLSSKKGSSGSYAKKSSKMLCSSEERVNLLFLKERVCLKKMWC